MLDHDEHEALTLFGSDPGRDRYRALWAWLRGSGEPILHDMMDSARFINWVEGGGYPARLIRLDPLANPDAASELCPIYHLPANADWDTILTSVLNDEDSLILWDPVTDHSFLGRH